MKTPALVLAVALGLSIAIATERATASGTENWNALGVVGKLQSKVSALESRVAELERTGTSGGTLALEAKVAELERNLARLQSDMKLTESIVDDNTRTYVAPPLQIKTQDQILQVLRRGMFVPAK